MNLVFEQINKLEGCGQINLYEEDINTVRDAIFFENLLIWILQVRYTALQSIAVCLHRQDHPSCLINLDTALPRRAVYPTFWAKRWI